MEKKAAFRSLIFYLKGLAVTSTITPGKRNIGDFLAERIVQAGTESSLASFVERLAALLGSSTGAIWPSTTAGFLQAATGKYSASLLRWTRLHPQIVAHLVGVPSKMTEEHAGERSDFEILLDTLDIDALIPDISDERDSVAGTFQWDIPIQAHCLSPLVHGSDAKSGNSTLFRRMQVLGKTGTTMSLPFYAGNALRGILRDIMADHFLAALGKPGLELWFFHSLYSGGALEEGGGKAKKAVKAMGDFGTVRVAGIHDFRDMLPGLSLFGAAIGTKILSGRLMVGDLRPRCHEWGTGDIAAEDLLDWQFLTRRDDNEDRGGEDKHQGMIVNTETLKTGTILDGGIDISNHASPLEKSALGRFLATFRDRGLLGADNSRGFGKATFVIDGVPDPAAYDAFLQESQGDILAYLKEIGAIRDKDE